jgi:hypothetical protein
MNLIIASEMMLQTKGNWNVIGTRAIKEFKLDFIQKGKQNLYWRRILYLEKCFKRNKAVRTAHKTGWKS